MKLTPKFYLEIYFDENNNIIYMVKKRKFLFFNTLYNETDDLFEATQWLVNLYSYNKLKNLL
jgi:hypothetical protein